MQMLYDKSVWQKYAGRDQVKAANWAPIPKAPVVTVVVRPPTRLRPNGITQPRNPAVIGACKL